MTARTSIAEQIALVERKLDVRRQRTVRHWDEVRSSLHQATKWLPLLPVGGALVAGLMLARRPAPAVAAPVARAGFIATLVSVAGVALRLGLSPQTRALWSAWRAARTAPPRSR